MGLNKLNGNMYEWVSGTKNPLAGKCLHGCTYCSTNSLKRFPVMAKKYTGEIRIDPKVLRENWGNGRTYFIVGQNDLFAKGVPKWVIHEILEYCEIFDNTYLFQTKNPERFIEFLNYFPAKTILCTTIETNRIYSQMGKTPRPDQRAYAMNCISGFIKYVTIEPIMDFDLKEMVILLRQCNPNKVNIGSDSKNHHLPEPSKEKLLAFIDELKKFTVIDQKRNLSRLLK